MTADEIGKSRKRIGGVDRVTARSSMWQIFAGGDAVREIGPTWTVHAPASSRSISVEAARSKRSFVS